MKKILFKWFLFAITLFIALNIFCLPTFAVRKVANDPTRISVGARALGMGKAFAGVADDASSIFINPAGIGSLKQWQITSMSGNFINEINYSQFAGIYPTENGNFGIAYIGSNLGFSGPSVVSVESGGEIIYVPSTSGAVSYDYNNSALILSYGVDFAKYSENSFFKHVSFGTNLKFFSQGLTGTGISGGSATGYDLDLGFLFRPTSWASFGLNQQNTLPFDMGGKIIWSSTGAEEAIPSKTKLGAAVSFGRDGGLLEENLGTQKLTLAYDLDVNLMDESDSATSTTVPPLMHFGAEWWATKFAALRFGIDQDVLGSGSGDLVANNNLTFGIGIQTNEFRFDYAYHQYNGLPENDTHYFSITYGLFVPKVEKPNYFKVDTPKDKSILYDKEVYLTGRILEPEVFSVSINKQKVPIKNKIFTAPIALQVGRNQVAVTAYDKSGAELQTKNHRLVRLMNFKDVYKDYWARLPIETLATLGIIKGYPNGTFRPNGGITRAELTTLLIRTKSEDPPRPTKKLFRDVSLDNWAAPFITIAGEEEIVKGYPNGTFRPNQKVSRAEGIALVARFDGLTPSSTLVQSPFPDLSTRHWAAGIIDTAKNAGMLRFLEGKSLDPNLSMSRAEATEILSKTRLMSAKIRHLLFMDEKDEEPVVEVIKESVKDTKTSEDEVEYIYEEVEIQAPSPEATTQNQDDVEYIYEEEPATETPVNTSQPEENVEYIYEEEPATETSQ